MINHRGKCCAPYVMNVVENTTRLLNSEVRVAVLLHPDASEGLAAASSFVWEGAAERRGAYSWMVHAGQNTCASNAWRPSGCGCEGRQGICDVRCAVTARCRGGTLSIHFYIIFAQYLTLSAFLFTSSNVANTTKSSTVNLILR